MNATDTPTPTGLLAKLSATDRERLGEAMRRLLQRGSILGIESSQTALYHWCIQNRQWLDELTGLVGLKVFWDLQERMVQAVPEGSTFLMRLRLDATLVLLTLWYEFDTAVRDRSETPPIKLTIQQLNDSLMTKFEPLRKHLPSATRLREILTQAQGKNLLRLDSGDAFESWVIQVLPTLKRVIPFQDIEEWNKSADRYLASVKEDGARGESNLDAVEDTYEETAE